MSLATVFLCSDCHKVYDEEERKPCMGACSHSKCLQCCNISSTCRICIIEDSFSEKIVNWDAMSNLKTVTESVNGNFVAPISSAENLNYGPCFECKDYTRLRVCATCMEEKGMMEKLSDLNWHKKPDFALEDDHDVFLKVKSNAICSNCSLDGDHQGHKIVQIQEFSKTVYDLEFRNVLTLQKIIEKKHEKETFNCEKAKEFVKMYLACARSFEFVKKMSTSTNLKENMLSSIPKEYPRLVEAAEAAYEVTKPVCERGTQLFDRLIRCKSEQLDQNILKAIEITEDEKFTDESRMEWTLAVEELKRAQQVINECVRSHSSLTSSDIQEIDRKIKKLMAEMENAERKESLITLEDDSKYFKYQALKKEKTESEQLVEVLAKKLEIDKKQNASVISERSKKLTRTTKFLDKIENVSWTQDWQDYEDNYNRILVTERVEKEMEINYMLLQSYKAFNRTLEARIMQETYFPALFGRSHEDDIYDQLLSELPQCNLFNQFTL